MLFLAESLLKAAGFKHDEIDDTWIAPVRFRPAVTVECDENRGGLLSLVGLTRAKLAAVA